MASLCVAWNCVVGGRIKIRVILRGDGFCACEKSVCLALWRPQPPGAASSMLFISNETFYKKKKSLRGPHQLHADIVFPLTNSGVFAASVIDRLILEPAGCVSYSPAAFLLPFGQRELKEGGGGGMMGGGGHSAFLLLLPPPPWAANICSWRATTTE